MIDILVQPKRDRFAAMRFFRKVLEQSPASRDHYRQTSKLWRREEINPAASDSLDLTAVPALSATVNGEYVELF